jgi:hypothetical protein
MPDLFGRVEEVFGDDEGGHGGGARQEDALKDAPT